MHQRDTEGLKRHAQQKRAQAQERTEAGIRQLLKEGRPINFEAVAEISGVSRAWLYNQPDIKARIEQLRDQCQSKPVIPKVQRASDASNSSLVKTLKQQIKKLQAENQGLRQHLEVVHGRSLYAEEQLEQCKREMDALKLENSDFKKQLAQHCYQSVTVTTTSSTVVSPPLKTEIASQDKTSQIQSEIANLGIKLNSTLNKAIKSASEDTVLNALEALKKAIAARVVKNPAGWLKRAIEEGWQPNADSAQISETSEMRQFKEWFPLARNKGVVVASIQNDDGNLLVLTLNEEWLPFAEVLGLYPLESLK